jgi:CheY-like chemotaxis protein
MENVLARLIGDQIEFDVRLGPELKKIVADADQIEQVVMNLVVNARDAISQTGSIILNVRNVTLDDQAGGTPGDLASGDYVMLSISDSGMGMDGETRSHIFEPFFTTKGVEEGTGLGLSTVFGIVKQSGGEIEVESEPGRGSDFRIYFPCVDACESDAEQQELRTGPLEGSETILIVEDEEAILNLLKHTLEKLGYTVLVAGHGKEALLAAERHGRRIDLMITDVIMPQMGGYELVDRLAPLHPKMSVLFTSAYSEEMVSDQALAKPQKQIICKPFTPQEVAERIRAILDNPPST